MKLRALELLPILICVKKASYEKPNFGSKELAYQIDQDLSLSYQNNAEPLTLRTPYVT